jgi:hypothetical protein
MLVKILTGKLLVVSFQTEPLSIEELKWAIADVIRLILV